MIVVDFDNKSRILQQYRQLFTPEVAVEEKYSDLRLLERSE